jgi:hypothetical protein
MSEHHDLRTIIRNQEKIMADLSRLNAAVADLSAKVDAMNAKPAPVPPVDQQSEVDAVTSAVEAIAAKIPT